CVNRLLVHDAVYDRFVDTFTAAVAGLRLGDVHDPATQVGPLVSERAVAKVEAHVTDALTHGARLALGGARLDGLAYRPTVLTEATPAMRIAQEQVFGPVAAIFRFGNEAEAIAMANDTPFGLAAYLYSRDVGRCWRVALQVLFTRCPGLTLEEPAPVKDSWHFHGRDRLVVRRRGVGPSP
ncbi:MAG: aldehyde dehydrogenase family protein, partial [Gemmatimonas sp.]|uniref:aldehyde dehydrogenase family protein n=1 Tax=Gemmatimonas sp. TaxID=1962908 RepID=UPI00391F1609